MQTMTPNTTPAAAPRRSRLAIAVAIAALAAGIGVAVLGGDNEPASTLDLSLGESNAMASCLAFDPAVLAEMPVAFEGTVTSVDGSIVTLEVDRWFAGGDASVVTLTGEHSSPALIDGFEFVPGSSYLVSATGGTVNYCGFSGASTPELLAGYEAAFAG